MLHSDTVAFLMRCATWAFIAWAAWSQPIVRQTALDYRAAWVRAWQVEHHDCDVQAYGLIFRRACAE